MKTESMDRVMRERHKDGLIALCAEYDTFDERMTAIAKYVEREIRKADVEARRAELEEINNIVWGRYTAYNTVPPEE